MNKELQKLINKREKLLIKIRDFNDGFFYKISIMIYGNLFKDEFNNESEFLDTYYEYESGDNGIIKTIETNNPDIISDDKFKSYFNK